MKKVIGKIFSLIIFIAIIASAGLFLNYQNVFGYFNPGLEYKAFSSEVTDENFDNALEFFGETVFSKQEHISKWTKKIKLKVVGAGKKDIEVLNLLISSFNTIKGFPGIEIADSSENAAIYYIKPEEISEYREKLNAEKGGASFTSYKFNSDNSIASADIVIKNELFQGYKNSTVTHEFFHLIGVRGHTKALRKSIMNVYGPVSGLGSTDLLVFKMLYSDYITPGMTESELPCRFKDMKVKDFLIKQS